MAEEEEYSTIPQMAVRCHVSPSTIYRWVLDFKAPGQRVGQWWRIPVDQFMDWVENESPQAAAQVAYITLSEAARLLGVSRHAVQQYIRFNRLPVEPRRHSREHYRINREAFIYWKKYCLPSTGCTEQFYMEQNNIKLAEANARMSQEILELKRELEQCRKQLNNGGSRKARRCCDAGDTNSGRASVTS